jgi:hypothetical protein
MRPPDPDIFLAQVSCGGLPSSPFPPQQHMQQQTTALCEQRIRMHYPLSVSESQSQAYDAERPTRLKGCRLCPRMPTLVEMTRSVEINSSSRDLLNASRQSITHRVKQSSQGKHHIRRIAQFCMLLSCAMHGFMTWKHNIIISNEHSLVRCTYGPSSSPDNCYDHMNRYIC